ncbi:hypothetical protein L3X38_029881 [Prunus dulcis]|uniref:Uncharacterized protein n=1 Tax=Prunus dulcis TaxID=3755 RepID=A0AAD4VSP1_PRUDU|nr:hypothetical protein L3X38_029881 [Prunus dulcis]
MVRSFVSASTMKITTVHNVAISRGLGSVSDYGDQELVNLEVINHLVTTVKPEAFFFCVAWFLGVSFISHPLSFHVYVWALGK